MTREVSRRNTEVSHYHKETVLKKEFEEGRISKEDYKKFLKVNKKSYSDKWI